MFSSELLRDLFRHMEWADAEVWRAVLATDAARTDTMLRDYLLHLHGVQRSFINLWTKQPYHRGQVNARLRAVGGQPPLVDYIAWVLFGRPAPDWTSAPIA